MKDKKSIIDIYYLELYQVYLVVANKYTTVKQLSKKYVYCNDEVLDDRILNGLATTSKCFDIKTGAKVVLVKYNKDSSVKGINKKVDRINTIAHEATHVALDIYENLDQDICYCTPEPFCYLVGWATECIYKTLTK